MPNHVKKLPNLGNKNASMGADGKMTIISSKMAKNQKLDSLYPKMKKMKYVDPKTGKDVEKRPAAPKMGHSPAEMSPYKMESAKQEKYNLLHDNPIAKHGSWMSKHSKSALHMGHKGSPAKHKLEDATKGTHWHAEDGTIITEKEGKKHKQKLPTGPNVPTQMKYDSPAGKHCM